jgi:hypothetical protein
VDDLAHGEVGGAPPGIHDPWLGPLRHHGPGIAAPSPAPPRCVVPLWPPMLKSRLGSTRTHCICCLSLCLDLG